MNLIWSKDRSQGFTRSDLLIVLVVVALGLLMIVMAGPFAVSTKSPRIKCLSHLKQIGLAFRLWSGDHGGRFPMSVSPFEGGTLGFSRSDDAFYHFLATSNEMNTPKVLVCPCDHGRKQATNFAAFSNRNLSYFVGLDADEHDPQTILSGDRNVSTNGSMISGILPLTGKPAVNWTKEIHVRRGNIGLADGSVQQASDAALMSQIKLSTNLLARAAIP
jgi:hypothetical protein